MKHGLKDLVRSASRAARSGVAIASILALSLFASACKNNQLDAPDAGRAGTGSVTVSVAGNGEARLVMPTAPSASTIARYDVTCSRAGYGNKAATGLTDTSALTINELAEGEWSVSIDAYDGAGTKVATGFASVTIVAGKTATAAVTLSPLFPRTAGGQGTVSLAFACSGFDVSANGWEIVMERIAGGTKRFSRESNPSALTIDPVGKTVALTATLDSGDWDMTFTYAAASGNYVTATTVVKVYDGMTSVNAAGGPIPVSLADFFKADRVRYVSNTTEESRSGKTRGQACMLMDAINAFNSNSTLTDADPGVIILTEDVVYAPTMSNASLVINRPVVIRSISSDTLSMSIGTDMTNSFFSVNHGGGDTGSLTLERVTVKPTSASVGAQNALVILSGSDGEATLSLKSGAFITGNTKGSGVSIAGGRLIMGSGSEISGNKSDYGGGVRMVDGYTNALELRGGLIRANRATIAAGGVSLSSAATLTVASGAWKDTVRDNQADIALPDLARGYAGVSQETTITNALSAPEPAYIDLLASATISIASALTVEKPVAIIGESPGSTLYRTVLSLPIFLVGDGGSLTLTGAVTLNGQPDSATMPIVNVLAGGTFVMNGANVSLINSLNDSGAEPYGGGVRVAGTFLLKDGSIGKYGYNSCFLGAGVFVASGGVMTMTGGSIMNNSAEIGGGVYVDGGGKCYLYDGEIVSNHGSTNGGGIYVYSGGKLHVRNYNQSLYQAINGNVSDNGEGLYVQNTPLPAGEVFFSTEQEPSLWDFLPGSLASITSSFQEIFVANDFVIPNP